MKKAILYYSEYGTTKQYAIWTNEILNYDIFDIQDMDKDRLIDYDQFIIFSSITHNTLSALPILKKYQYLLHDKISLIVSCGFINSDQMKQKVHDVFTNTPITFLPGAFNQDLKWKDLIKTYQYFNYYYKNPDLKKVLHYGQDTIDKQQIQHIIHLINT